MDNLVKMRAGWHSGAEHCQSVKTAPPPIDPLAFVWLDHVNSGQSLSKMLQDRAHLRAVQRMHPYCPMFARKFLKSTVLQVMRLLSQPPMRVVADNVSNALELYNQIAAPS